MLSELYKLNSVSAPHVTLKIAVNCGDVFRTHEKKIWITQTQKKLLAKLPVELWAKNSTDMGLPWADPVKIILNEGTLPIFHPQYSLNIEQIEGIGKNNKGFIRQWGFGKNFLTVEHGHLSCTECRKA